MSNVHQLNSGPLYAKVADLPDDIATRRLQVKQKLAGAYRIFAARGLDFSILGHITARDPEHANHFWIAPAGAWFGEVKASDLVRVDHDANVIEGAGPINRAGFLIHSEIHKARPDVHAVAHAHSLYGKAWASQGRLLDPITSDSCHFYGQHTIFEHFSGVVLDVEEAVAIARTLADNRAIILQNHGILTTGGSVDSAIAQYVAFENACQVQLISEAAGTPRKIGHDVAQKVSDLPRGDDPGYHAFHPLWRRILKEQPDFLD